METKFEHIASDLIEDIKSGKYSRKLPSERDLARIYNTTPITAAKALNYLQEKNIVFRKRGNGTFISDSPEKRVTIKIFMQNDFLHKGIDNLLTKRFPEYSFDFSGSVSIDIHESFKNNDIIWHSSSVMPGEYDSLCRPLPFAFVSEKLENSAYNTETFKIHKSHLHYYGLPLLYSPILLTYNKTLLKKIKIPLPDAPYTLSQIYELKKLLGKHKGIHLFDATGMHFSPAINCIFVHVPAGSSLSEIKLENLRRGLNTLDELYSASIASDASFESGNTLFCYNCRQTLEKRGMDQFDFEWDILPAFYVNTNSCTVASESCFISASSTLADDVIIPVLDFLIGKEVQNFIAEKHFGIPVLKSSALDSMKNSSYRDDYFFREREHIIYENNLFEKDLLWIFGAYVYEYMSGSVSYKHFMSDVEKLFTFSSMKRKASSTNKYEISM